MASTGDDRISKLKELFPEIIVNGKIDLNKLREVLGDLVDQEPYSFDWPGKGQAVALQHWPVTAAFEFCQEESVNWQTTGNLFIEGDNLDALKLLNKAYQGKIKMIYIDPPYNTKSPLLYADNFTDHARWLSMMYPRLALARQLLQEDGAIFISIDDHEIAQLILLMNEIFGEENFVSVLKWKRKRKPAYLSSHVATLFEYVVVYARNKSKLRRLTVGMATDNTRPVLNAGNKISERVLPAGADAKCGDGILPPGTYGGRSLKFELLDAAEIKKGRLVNDVRVRGPFRVPQEIFAKFGYITARKALRRYVSEEEKQPKLISDGLLDVGTNEDAENELKELFGGICPMDYPKPVSLIKFLAAAVTGNDDIVLDFFAGSCTTAQAVLELNHEDGGNRRFIMVQHAEPVRKTSRAYKAGFETISEIGKERIRRVLAKMKDITEGTGEDPGFRVLKVIQKEG